MPRQIFAVFLMSFLFTGVAFSADSEPVPAPTESSSSFWRWSLGGGFSLGSRGTWRDTNCDGCSGHPDVDVRYSEAATLLLETRWSPTRDQWGWGFIGGLSVDSERKAETVKIYGNEVAGTSNSKLQVSTLYANAVYQFGPMYLPFGLNIDSVKFTPDSSFDGTYDARGGLGTQVGFGYLFDDHWSIEGLLRVNVVKLETKDASGNRNDYGTGYLSALLVTGRYTF